MSELIRTELASDGVLTAFIDMPDRSMNVFSADLMDALEALIDRVEDTPAIGSVVVTSGKPAFLAGADLDMIRGFTDRARTDTEEQMFTLCGRLGRLFVRIEASPKPWVAAVNGTALGGGLELALACRARLVSDDPRSLIGLPEVRWGLLPGAGGTQRLPRTVGFKAGMSLLLSGRPLSPADATTAGIFARAVPAADLIAEASALARGLQGQPYDVLTKFPYHNQAGIPEHTPDAVRAVGREHGVTDADFENYPAYGAIINSVLLGAGKPLAEASAIEMRQFLRLMFDPVAGNMVRTLFLSRQRADRDLAPPKDLRIEGINFGELTDSLWRDALAKSRLLLTPDVALPTNTIELLDTRGRRRQIAVRSLADTAMTETFTTPTAVLSPLGPYGRVLELIRADEEAAEMLACLAVHLGALPYRTNGAGSILARLAYAAPQAPALLDAQALAALQLAAEGLVPDVEVLDVAACAAGVTPAYSGGPLTHLWQHRERLETTVPPALARAWVELEDRLRSINA
ncbi:enoyl-CoA hydratase-related protein [Aromatoleum toluolicum]|uniref:3-hydroxyacyl-CoA dehydrogenase n=1 Tax=Aromatoleum toluolicum TaxID=90060 RepID=A0ABX1NAX3_9RHOO|nr:enoyl-CoA hydratase-related protein [Aromatoleum toluolicum]NMF96414.1 enoyl-CoA hydratase-related protein [Aromatoleum toluolicum]